MYAKSQPAATFVDIEKKLRGENANVYLIALVSYHNIVEDSGRDSRVAQEKQKEGFESYTLIDLQGKLDCTYVVNFFFNDQPQRLVFKDRWPETPEQNLERLGDAGFPYDRMIPKCGNCGRE